MANQIGPVLRELRQQAGLTQEQLADRSGVAVRTIRRLESDQRADPRIKTVTLLADALDVTPENRRTLLAPIANPGGDALPGAPPEPDPLREAADQLARAVRSRWQREEEQRRVHDPFPLPVGWEPVPVNLMDSWQNIHRAKAPDMPGPLDLAGKLDDIADIYARIPSGRLVVLGGAGSGKTILTLRFVLDYLRTRTGADPIPVIFSLGSWDPTASTLRDWLIGQLLRDYPGLVAAAPGGSTLARELVETDRVLPVLDGFDELAEGLHRPALDALNRTSLPLLLTSRPDEYERAVAAAGVLPWAAGVRLTGLMPADLVEYLPRTIRTGGEPEVAWQPVLAELRDNPDGPLAEVLSTPLMVVLARTLYSDNPGSDPADLLDTTRFPAIEALEDHLLSSFVPTVYRAQPPHLPDDGRPRRDWDPDRAQRWLGYLARHLDRLGTRNLAWWQLGDSLSRSTRILAVVLACALGTALFDWLFFVPRNLIRLGTWFSVGTGLLDGVIVGPAVGIAFGLVYGVAVIVGGAVFEPSRAGIRLLGRSWRPRAGLVHYYPARFGAGLLGGFVVGLGYYPAVAVLRGVLYGFPPALDGVIESTLTTTVLNGLIFGLAAGLVFGLVTALETPLDISSAANPVAMLATNRATVVRQILLIVPTLAVAIAVGGQLAVSLFPGFPGANYWDPINGILVGLMGGLSGTFAYACAFTAWGQWVILSRVWLPLTGKVPWSLVEFLDDAYHRGVLRQAGAVYQFRHARLQDQLSRTVWVPVAGDRKGEAG